MGLPIRYSDVLDFFEGLQVAGEMTETNEVYFKRVKLKKSLQVLTKTALGKSNGYMDRRQFFFRDEKFGKEQKFYFSFTLTLERNEDEILIHAFLPAAAEGDVLLSRGNRVLKMYQNGFLYDLRKNGYSDARIEDVSGTGYELFVRASSNVSYEDIAQLYNQVKLMNTRAFDAAGAQL